MRYSPIPLHLRAWAACSPSLPQSLWRNPLEHVEPQKLYQGESAMKIKRKGSAAWQGGIKDGKGTISTESGALKAYPYGFASRFEGQKGSNPEELIGAAHASCFTMALSLIL